MNKTKSHDPQTHSPNDELEHPLRMSGQFALVIIGHLKGIFFLPRRSGKKKSLDAVLEFPNGERRNSDKELDVQPERKLSCMFIFLTPLIRLMRGLKIENARATIWRENCQEFEFGEQ